MDDELCSPSLKYISCTKLPNCLLYMQLVPQKKNIVRVQFPTILVYLVYFGICNCFNATEILPVCAGQSLFRDEVMAAVHAHRRTGRGKGPVAPHQLTERISQVGKVVN